MARLAMVSPATASERRRRRLYWDPQSKMGKKYCRARTSFLPGGWFLKRCSGSSGKKTSASRCRSAWHVVLRSGADTLCRSTPIAGMLIARWCSAAGGMSTLVLLTTMAGSVGRRWPASPLPPTHAQRRGGAIEQRKKTGGLLLVSCFLILVS